jgi:uncharacterized protein DUF1553/uncharacterized protein DUF1549/concanavalin A-like lectin/glucanase superfamily protein/cytochrome c
MWSTAARFFLAVGCLAGVIARAQTVAPSVNFDRQIRSIFSDRCFACHGPDEKQRIAKLRLDVRDGGAFERKIVVPGAAQQSLLFQRISSDRAGFRMPPTSAGNPLTAAQIELIGKWIDQGAKWENHWAYVAPKRPDVPPVSNPAWARNPIDAFVEARLDREKLKPSAEADKVTVIRRVTLDLTGLPPTIAEVNAFLADKQADAYEKVVDRLLHSPRYGERMAMQWLDLARYADTHGYHIDSSREMWHWRDWVIQAFNDNMPYDRFTIEQLAGDLLPGSTDAQKVASGFNRNHMINFEGGAIPEEYQNEYVVDRLEATATTWMGMTLGCARCHDHKYDPLSQKEFYRFYAFFNSISEEGLDGKRGNAKPFLQLPSAEQKARLDGLDQEIAKRQKLVDKDATAPMQQKWEAERLATLASVTRDGLTAHYALDGNLNDSSGAYRVARVRQGDLTFSPGYVDRAADFDGDTHVSLGDGGVIYLGRAFTIAGWVRVGASKDMALLATVPRVKEKARLEVGLDDFQLVDIQRWAPRVTIRVGGIELRSKGHLQPEQWHHLAIASDGSGRAAGFKLFFEGKAAELEVVKDGALEAGKNSSSIEIGDKELGRAFKGSIDELRIYNRVLAASELEPMVMSEPVRATLLMLDAKRSPAQRDRLRDYFLTYEAPQEYRTAWVELKALERDRAELIKVIPTAMVMSEMEKPRETVVLARGDYRNRGEKVSPGIPAVLPPLPAGPANRLTLARWLVSPENPLAARVAVNRFWQMYFGLGIVKTAEDFGSQGEPPSNPELLDWLATEFERTGWDIRAMQRLIVTSATYRQASTITPELRERDPENRLLARGPRFRLPAEMIRDGALEVSGLLRERVGGPSVHPNQPGGLWEAIAYGDGFSSQTYVPSTGDDLYRRSMYSFWKRTSPPPALTIFDAPDREKCTARRLLTNTPLQALALMNDPTYIEAARALAARAIAEEKTADGRIKYAFRLAVAREPKAEEIRVLRELEQKEIRQYRTDPEAAKKLAKADGKTDPVEMAAWTTVASSILNLDEMITKQ